MKIKTLTIIIAAVFFTIASGVLFYGAITYEDSSTDVIAGSDQSEGGFSVELQSNQVNTSVNDEVGVEVRLVNTEANGFVGVELYIEYDPEVLEYTSVDSQDNFELFFPPIAEGGILEIVAADSDQLLDDELVISTLTFTRLQEGPTTISLVESSSKQQSQVIDGLETIFVVESSSITIN